MLCASVIVSAYLVGRLVGLACGPLLLGIALVLGDLYTALLTMPLDDLDLCLDGCLDSVQDVLTLYLCASSLLFHSSLAS